MPPDTPPSYPFRNIGTIRSPYREKFAVPRQPGLVTAARAELQLLGDCNREEILRGLEGFSHVWILFVFDQVVGQGWKPMVRPPRLGGNRRVGLFASRSPFRPNPIGLSVVPLERIEQRDGRWILHLTGVDLVDRTPVLDIKPYVPAVDAVPEARGGFTRGLEAEAPQVWFNDQARRELAVATRRFPDLETLIRQVIAQQPQPAYQKPDDREREYGMALYEFNVRWRRAENGCEVIAIDASTV